MIVYAAWPQQKNCKTGDCESVGHTGINSFDAPNTLAACQCLDGPCVRGRTYQNVEDVA